MTLPRASVNNLMVMGILLVMIALMLPSCSSGNGDVSPTIAPLTPLVNSTRQVTPTLAATPTQIVDTLALATTATFVAEKSPQPTNEIVPRNVSLTDDLVLPNCSPVTRGNGSIGTVPLPTATPIPEAADGIQEDIDVAYAVADLMVENIIELVTQADANWAVLNTDQERANHLYTEIVRVGHLCGAAHVSLNLSQTDDFSRSFLAALLNRVAALESAWVAVRDGIDLKVSDELRAVSTKRVGTLLRDLEFYSSVNGAAVDRRTLGSQYFSNLLNIGVSVPTGWIVIRDDVQLVIQAPTETQSLKFDELGPESWELGHALRVRRFGTSLLLRRSEPEFVLAELMLNMGSEISTGTTDINGETLFTGEYVTSVPPWRVLAAVMIRDASTYLLELACRQGERDRCDALFGELLESFEPE